MKVSRKLNTVRYQRVGRDIIQNYPAVDYETLWQVSFALENKVTHARQVWFIQDDQEERKEGRRRLAAAERQGQSSAHASHRLNKYIEALLDMCAFIGGAWFVLTRVVFGPLSQLFEHDLYVADVDQRVIVKEHTGAMAPISKDSKAANLE